MGRHDGDGLITHPHTHYAGQPITEYHRHELGKACANVRNEKSENIAPHLNLDEKPKSHPRNLHNVDRGQIGMKKRLK